MPVWWVDSASLSRTGRDAPSIVPLLAPPPSPSVGEENVRCGDGADRIGGTGARLDGPVPERQASLARCGA